MPMPNYRSRKAAQSKPKGEGNLYCPNCQNRFKSVLFENRTVCCPNCKHVMFAYLEPDEHMSRQEFMKLLNTDRGAAAGVAAAEWFRGGKKVRLIRGSLLVAHMWPHLAGTLD